jgi:hypothetical protein
MNNEYKDLRDYGFEDWLNYYTDSFNKEQGDSSFDKSNVVASYSKEDIKEVKSEVLLIK